MNSGTRSQSRFFTPIHAVRHDHHARVSPRDHSETVRNRRPRVFIRYRIFLVQRNRDSVSVFGCWCVPMRHVSDEVIWLVIFFVCGPCKVRRHETRRVWLLRCAAFAAHRRKSSWIFLRVLANFFVFVVDKVDVAARRKMKSGSLDISQTLIRTSQSGSNRFRPDFVFFDLKFRQICRLFSAVNLRRWSADWRRFITTEKYRLIIELKV